MAFAHLTFNRASALRNDLSITNSKKTRKQQSSAYKISMKNLNANQKNSLNVNPFLSFLLTFGILSNPYIVNAIVDQKPTTNVIDESGSLTKASVNFIEKSLSKLKETNGGEVYFVSIRSLPFEKTPQEYAQELFQKWELKDKDVVVVLANKIAKAGIYYGNQVTALSDATAKSIGEETYPFKAKEEQYGSAAIDVNNRLVSILSNKGDPGPPVINRNSNASNFKTAKKTEEQRSKYIAIIVILLVIAFVVPMFQFFWYVKDE